MAVSETPRHKLKKYSAGTDPHPTRATFNGEVDKIEDLPAVKQGSTGSRPVSGVGKVLYWDESVKRFVYDDGTEWNDVAPIGGVTPTAVKTTGAGSEGTSPRAARADHVHQLALATDESHGAMSATDKALLGTATYLPEGSSLVRRHITGSIQVETGSNAKDAANKGYVDARASGNTGAIRVAQGLNAVTPTTSVTESGETYYRGSILIPFPEGRFSSTPRVVVSGNTEVPGSVRGTGATEVSTTGFRAWVARNNTTAVSVTWIAIQS